MQFFKNSLAILLLIVVTNLFAGQKDYLTKCWTKQAKIRSDNYLSLAYAEKLNKLEHSFQPWQQSNYFIKGRLWCRGDHFLKQDTLTSGNTTYYSKTNLSKTDLVFLDYGDKDLSTITRSVHSNHLIESARYSPIVLLNYFVAQKIRIAEESNDQVAVYKTIINKTVVTFFIRKSDSLLDKITLFADDELFGDVLTTIHYSDYSTIDELSYPTTIQIQKINGKVNDELKISMASLVPVAPTLLDKPAGYTIKNDEEDKIEVKSERYNSSIHFIELKHTDDKCLVVEFKDFLLIAEAPLNSKNGELLINEARKIAPAKPIRYFVFGHYHPHYTGGMRPFIHKGAKIICTKGDEEYVKYLASAPHTLNPDSLQLQPKALQIQEVKDSLTITDGGFTMKIYFIGRKSEHTNDYLIYYFPAEKLLFEDDLVWIAKTGVIKKASKRQAGLYKAIKELGLDVKLIVQSWPVADYGVKTVIPFEDLEKSMTVD